MLSSYQYYIQTMSAYRTVSEILSVKNGVTLKSGVGVVQDHSKWRCSIDHWSAIVSIALCCTIFELFDDK